MQQQQRNKSLKTAYFLWLVGGLFGWHHFYLERDIQGFLWLCFPGGFFGLGWLRDFWRMPDYVDQVNDEHHMLHAKKQLINPKPLFSPSRFLAQNLVGNSFAYLVIGSVPNADIYGYNLNVIGTTILVPLAIASGIYLVGNIGLESGSFQPTVWLCYLLTPLQFGHVNLITLLATFKFQKSRTWKANIPSKKSGFVKRTFCVVIAFSLYICLWISCLYNVTIEDTNGEQIRLKDSNISKILQQVWQEIKDKGISDLISEILDPDGVDGALNTLGLNEESTFDEIKAKYRELSKKWHPDKFLNDEEKLKAQGTFMKIQQSYEILSKIDREEL